MFELHEFQKSVAHLLEITVNAKVILKKNNISILEEEIKTYGKKICYHAKFTDNVYIDINYSGEYDRDTDYRIWISLDGGMGDNLSLRKGRHNLFISNITNFCNAYKLF